MVAALTSEPISTLAYSLLALSILAQWLRDFRSPKGLLSGLLLVGLFNLVGVIAGRVNLVGIFAEVLLFFSCYAFFTFHLQNGMKLVLGAFIIIFSLALGLHQVPGFRNWKVFSDVYLSPDALPTQLYLNFDKAFVGFCLVGWGYPLIRTWKEAREIIKKSLPILLSVTSVLLGVSWMIGYLRWEPKWFEFSSFWLAVNLIFVCIAEEALFRGFIQAQLALLLKKWEKGPYMALLFTSLLSGIMHFHGGWGFMLLATIASLYYGYAFLRTQRLEASILVHFSVNAIHFIAFTYPALRTSL